LGQIWAQVISNPPPKRTKKHKTLILILCINWYLHHWKFLHQPRNSSAAVHLSQINKPWDTQMFGTLTPRPMVLVPALGMFILQSSILIAFFDSSRFLVFWVLFSTVKVYILISDLWILNRLTSCFYVLMVFHCSGFVLFGCLGLRLMNRVIHKWFGDFYLFWFTFDINWMCYNFYS